MARGPRARTAPDGLVVVDKPAGMTSHDVVARVRRIIGTRKVGHAGTLDPMATGVLVLDDRPQLFFGQAAGMGQDAGDENIEEAVHLGLHAGIVVPDRMMQAGGEFHRDVLRRARHENLGDLGRQFLKAYLKLLLQCNQRFLSMLGGGEFVLDAGAAGTKSGTLWARDFTVLGDQGINIEMISTSPIKISCMIARSEIPNAVRELHAAFELENEPIHEV